MPIDPRLLTLTQWLSPAYPLGAFAYSHGLEAAVQGGQVSDGRDLQAWLEDLLASGTGRNDAIWIRLAADPAADLAALDAEARAFQPSAERLREADRQGAAFARVTAEIWNLDLPPLLLPVALGRAAEQMGMDPGAVAALYLQGFAGNLVAAGQRLLALGQTEAQGILAALAPLCQSVAEATEGAGQGDLWSVALLWDIASMQHETSEPRLFQS
ncbi:urease accessory protein UreF [Pseudoponticoccus marisrubri]|uniref:Urease accessory protein UreF n=1 Tax=Pseudoponticoccus marisrubri TaxID=1685382 RepID=A0A0W7WFN8_9RHOB|nr:urease accessory UreF family protein [Pseudoponticoccus marisrubri]KUF09382.1 urease accessory protein UreF [Pseudoponticoccus marisrubri]